MKTNPYIWKSLETRIIRSSVL